MEGHCEAACGTDPKACNAKAQAPGKNNNANAVNSANNNKNQATQNQHLNNVNNIKIEMQQLPCIPTAIPITFAVMQAATMLAIRNGMPTITQAQIQALANALPQAQAAAGAMANQGISPASVTGGPMAAPAMAASAEYNDDEEDEDQDSAVATADDADSIDDDQIDYSQYEEEATADEAATLEDAYVQGLRKLQQQQEEQEREQQQQQQAL